MKRLFGVLIMMVAVASAYSHAAGWQLSSSQYEPAKIPLEIIAPRAGLTIANRYYKAYPGITYRVPVVVLGGAFPFQYQLVSGPSGMTIGQHYGDRDYGIINYPNPVAGSYSVTVRVTDQQSNTYTVTWPLTVTKSGFIFVDAVHGHHSAANGGTGTGTINNPFLTMDDWYSGTVGSSGSNAARKADNTYSGYFVYYRAGTYRTSSTYTESGTGGRRVPCVSGNKPKVQLAYPGENVTFDVSGGEISFYSDSSGNYYMGGIHFVGLNSAGDNRAWSWDSGVNDIGSFESSYDATTPSVGSNAAAMMSRRAGGYSNYIFMSHNTYLHLNGYVAFLGYSTNKVVAEFNTINNNTLGEGFYAKINNKNWSIRANTGLAGNSRPLFGIDGYSTSDNIEVCWNNYKSSGDGALLGLTPDTPIGNVWLYRNTWQVADQRVANVTVNNLVVAKDVVTYTNSGANSHGWLYKNGASVSAHFSGESCVRSGSGCTDSSGNLTGSARTSYLGLLGHEIPTSSSAGFPPAAPDLSVH